jgi:hypothetical protein
VEPLGNSDRTALGPEGFEPTDEALPRLIFFPAPGKGPDGRPSGTFLQFDPIVPRNRRVGRRGVLGEPIPYKMVEADNDPSLPYPTCPFRIHCGRLPAPTNVASPTSPPGRVPEMLLSNSGLGEGPRLPSIFLTLRGKPSGVG